MERGLVAFEKAAVIAHGYSKLFPRVDKVMDKVYLQLNLRSQCRPATLNYKNNEEEKNEQRIRRSGTRQIR